MKTILDSFLALDKAFVLDALNHSLYVKDFWKNLGFNRSLRRGRGYEEFEQKFEINIIEATKKNLQQKKEQDKKKIF